jgi:hypothetical protein
LFSRGIASRGTDAHIYTDNRRPDELDRTYDRIRIGIQRLIGHRITQRVVIRRSFFQHLGGMGAHRWNLKCSLVAGTEDIPTQSQSHQFLPESGIRTVPHSQVA